MGKYTESLPEAPKNIESRHAILVGGGIEELPEAIADQLAEGGRIVALFLEGALGVVRLGRKLDGRIDWRMAFNAAAPLLPGFARRPGFVL